MKEVSHRESFAIIARALGAVFYFPPDSEQAAQLVTALTTTDWYRDWPLAEESLLPVADSLRATTDETLPEAWQRLFIGPWALPAPPWGSVWLDRESVLFGESTLALRQWMRDNGITFDMPQNEPEDHFGTMLMHLLPWSQRFLTVLRENARHPFYVGIAELAQMTLVDWQSRLPIPVIEKTLYR